jgi:hypothetical protein
VFDFLENQPLELPAYADTHVLDVQLPTEQAASFLLELVGQSAVKIIFPRRDEAPGLYRPMVRNRLSVKCPPV